MDPSPARFIEGMTITPSPTLLDPVTDADHVRGNPDALVTLVEYGEFECPDCGRAYHSIKQLLDEVSGEVRFVFRHFARDEVHPFSERSAVAAEAAGAQGHFWEMHDFLFERQHQLEYEDLFHHAAELGLDVERFRHDLLENPALLAKVRGDLETGTANGVVSTPTFFVNGIRHTGTSETADLLKAIRQERELIRLR